jgi:hypothetical protein
MRTSLARLYHSTNAEGERCILHVLLDCFEAPLVFWVRDARFCLVLFLGTDLPAQFDAGYIRAWICIGKSKHVMMHSSSVAATAIYPVC